LVAKPVVLATVVDLVGSSPPTDIDFPTINHGRHRDAAGA